MAALNLNARVDWVDYAKGICIVLVVMMHSTLGVEKYAGGISWLNGFIEWARPFRMPDFFVISGLFLASRIGRPWRSYLDTKVVHFVYFYILWMTIQFAAKGYGVFRDDGALGLVQAYLEGLVQPFGTLWFIYLLAVFFVITKALAKVRPVLVFAGSALLEMAPIETGSILIDEFAARYVYFFAGYWMAGLVFAFAEGVKEKSLPTLLAGLFIWAMVNTYFVSHGLSKLPVIGLALGFAGAAAVVTMGVLISKVRLAKAIGYCGENSIVIYLSFFLFMAATRSALLKFAPGLDLGLMSLIVTGVAVVCPMVLFWIVRDTRLSFLFRRPPWAKLATPAAGWHSARHAETAQSQAR